MPSNPFGRWALGRAVDSWPILGSDHLVIGIVEGHAHAFCVAPEASVEIANRLVVLILEIALGAILKHHLQNELAGGQTVETIDIHDLVPSRVYRATKRYESIQKLSAFDFLVCLFN